MFSSFPVLFVVTEGKMYGSAFTFGIIDSIGE